MDYEKEFSSRLTELRTKAGVSARDMSLSIGQNPGYIHNIESGKALPSMSAFFYICEYLKVTPSEFLNIDPINSSEHDNLLEKIRKLDKRQIKAIKTIVSDLATSK